MTALVWVLGSLAVGGAAVVALHSQRKHPIHDVRKEDQR